MPVFCEQIFVGIEEKKQSGDTGQYEVMKGSVMLKVPKNKFLFINWIQIYKYKLTRQIEDSCHLCILCRTITVGLI